MLKKYLKALPEFLEEFEIGVYESREKYFSNCFEARTFERFLEWFGFVEIERGSKNMWDRDKNIKATQILNKVFDVDT